MSETVEYIKATEFAAQACEAEALLARECSESQEHIASLLEMARLCRCSKNPTVFRVRKGSPIA